MATPQFEQDTQLVQHVNDAMAQALADRGLPGMLADAMAYAALGPGKRVRPVLVFRAAQAVGLDVNRDAQGLDAATSAAVAIEMIHAFSLVHDDLPAMDDDDLRRGRPTLHKHASEAEAILAGDALSALAFEKVSAVEPATLAQGLSAELSQATLDMIAGQIRDTFPHAESDEKALDALRETHRLKTGALLRCACRMGGLCGGASASQLEALTAYADATGLMFQVVDDLLDVTSNAQALGKATQKDAAAGKRTYPGLMGQEGARAEIKRLHDTAIAALDGFGASADALRALAEQLAQRKK